MPILQYPSFSRDSLNRTVLRSTFKTWQLGLLLILEPSFFLVEMLVLWTRLYHIRIENPPTTVLHLPLHFLGHRDRL
jgi:hypothetical protein